MSETQALLQAVFDELQVFSTTDKAMFLEELLFQFTLAGRGIWSGEGKTDSQKAEALKWLNELTHRIWNIHTALRQADDTNSIARLYDNLQFYGEQSAVLRQHLVPTIVAAFANVKARR